MSTILSLTIFLVLSFLTLMSPASCLPFTLVILPGEAVGSFLTVGIRNRVNDLPQSHAPVSLKLLWTYLSIFFHLVRTVLTFNIGTNCHDSGLNICTSIEYKNLNPWQQSPSAMHRYTPQPCQVCLHWLPPISQMTLSALKVYGCQRAEEKYASDFALSS